MDLVNLILAIIILGGIIILLIRQRKIRRLDKKIAENWKTIIEGMGAVNKTTKEVEEMLGITGIKLEKK